MFDNFIIYFSCQHDEKRTETKKYRGFSNEDQQQKRVESDEERFKGKPTKYGYRDTKKDLFA